MQNSYIPLESKNLNLLGVDAPSFGGANTSFYATSSFVYTLFFIAIVGAAFYQYILAGIYRMEASESTIRKSNETIKRTTLGLLGVFSLFLILFTVNKGLLKGDIGFEGLQSKTPASNNQTTKTSSVPTTVSRSAPFIPATTDDPLGWEAIRSDAAVRFQLHSLPGGGVGVNNSVCTVPTQTSCTTVGGLPTATISMITSLRQTCGGTITITGGVEAGHKSHGPGLSPVDLSINSPGGLNDCIRSFPPSDPLNWCKKTYAKFGYVFCDENFTTPHWHVFQN
jgi:hypothetical protein